LESVGAARAISRTSSYFVGSHAPPQRVVWADWAFLAQFFPYGCRILDVAFVHHIKVGRPIMDGATFTRAHITWIAVAHRALIIKEGDCKFRAIGDGQVGLVFQSSRHMDIIQCTGSAEIIDLEQLWCQ
jgi:hypothetical protein